MTGESVRRRQLACAAGLLPVLAWAVWATPAFVAALAVPCPEEVCETFERPSQQLLDLLGLSGGVYAAAVTVLAWALLLLCCGVAILLPRSRTSGPLVGVTAVLLPVAGAASFGSALAERSVAGRVVDTAAAVLIALLVPVFLGLFPDGQWHPRWFRWAWPLPAAVIAVSLAGRGLFGSGVGDSDAFVVVELANWLALLAIQVHRYRRRSDWVARAQTKALLVFVVLTVSLIVLGGIASVAGVLTAVAPALVLLDYASFAVLALGLLVAMFRHRLYGVDVALRRTTVYAAVLLALGLLYVLLVAVAGSLVSGAAAPVLGGAAVGVLALAGGVAIYALRERLRRRLFGGHGLARAIAAVARDPAPGPGDDLAATIARGLALPYVAVLDAGGDVVWSHGTGTDEDALHRELVVDPSGEKVGELVLTPPRGSHHLDRHHRRVLAEVLPFVVLVLRSREEAEQLRAARLAAAGAREDERRRLRRELHDGVGPLLATQLLTVDTLRVGGDRPELLAHLESQARSAIAEVRRVAHDIRPSALDVGGLPAALSAEADRLRRSGLPVELAVDLEDPELPAATETALLRIAQESLANVVRHAGASAVRVSLRSSESGIELVIDDDGCGPSGGTGLGTGSMRERAGELGGEVHIGASPDRGTRVHARIPR